MKRGSILVVDSDEARVSDGLVNTLNNLDVHAVHCMGYGLGEIERLAQPLHLVFLMLRYEHEAPLFAMKKLMSLDRTPAVVAVSDSASSKSVFEVARLGARILLETPVMQEEVLESIALAGEAPVLPRSLMRSLFGAMTVREAQRSLRQVLFEEAWTVAQGNRRGAARRLGVTRRAVQLMLAERQV